MAKNLSAPNVSTTAGSEVSRPENAAGNPVRAAVSALGQPAQLNRIRLPSLDRRSDHLVRRPLTSEVLRVKRAESGPDRRANPDDAFFHVWPKKRNPKITSEKQLWPAHRRWASGMLHAIVLHLLHGRCCVIHHPTSARRITVLMHLPLQNARVREAGCEFFNSRSSREIGFSPIRESTVRPIVRIIHRKVLSKP